MSNITNISANLQASKTYQSVTASTKQTKNGAESSLASIYESLAISESVTIELSGSGSLLDTYKTDSEKVNAMKADLDNNIDALGQMLMKLLDTQGSIRNVATDNLHKLVNKITESGGIEELAKSEAAALISEDGYWGVNRTAQRVLDFAKALGGGDPEKIELLRGAFRDGFKQAESLWAGELPEISHKTFEKMMRGFDDWSNDANVGEASTAEEE